MLGKTEIEPSAPIEKPTPGQWLEHSPILNWMIVFIGGTYLVRYFMHAGEPLSAINLNIVNLTFLLLGFLLHKTPARLMHAVQGATPAVWGVILQFPFYAGIAGVITSTHLSQRIAHMFVSISTAHTFPAIVATYSAVLGVFVPSGGSKWVVEAPYVMAAAHELKVHLGWVVASYDLGEALANLVQPFWMLPILGLFQLRARDVMGYTFIVFLVLVPVVLAARDDPWGDPVLSAVARTRSRNSRTADRKVENRFPQRILRLRISEASFATKSACAEARGPGARFRCRW